MNLARIWLSENKLTAMGQLQMWDSVVTVFLERYGILKPNVQDNPPEKMYELKINQSRGIVGKEKEYKNGCT